MEETQEDEVITLEIHTGDAIAFWVHPEAHLETFRSLIREGLKQSIKRYIGGKDGKECS